MLISVLSCNFFVHFWRKKNLIFFSLKVIQKNLTSIKTKRKHLNCWRIAQLHVRGFWTMHFSLLFSKNIKFAFKKSEIPYHTCHMPCATYHISNVTCHKAHITYHMSHVTCHVSHEICRMSHFPFCMSHITCHMSHVKYHISHVTCEISHVTCHMAHNFRCPEQL